MAMITVNDADTGRACPYCRFPLKGGAVAMQCDSCQTIHHEDCWRDGGGCSVFGCTNSAAAQKSSGQQLPPVGKPGPGDASIDEKGAPVVAGDQVQPAVAGPDNQKNTIVLAAIGILAATVLVIGLIAIVRLSSGGDESPAAAPPPVAEEPERERNEESDELAARKILRVLRDYTSAYSSEDRSGLAAIFTPNVQRWGVNGPETCKHDTGKHDVLNAYQSQFDANASLSYKLTPLGTSDVERIAETRARMATNYVINGGSPAPIHFSFERSDSSGWRISRVKVGACV